MGAYLTQAATRVGASLGEDARLHLHALIFAALSGVCPMWVAFQITAATSALARPSVVFTDCDGTMLSPAHSLSARSRSVLRELDRLGVRVVPATGRARAGSWTEDVLTEPALRGGSPGVFCNGCIAYDTDGSALPPATLPRELPSALLRTLAAPGAISCCPIAYVGDEALHDSGSAALLSQLAEVGDSPLRCVADLSAACEAAAVTKILLLHASGSDSDALRASVSATVCNGGGALTQALDWMLEACSRHYIRSYDRHLGVRHTLARSFVCLSKSCSEAR